MTSSSFHPPGSRLVTIGYDLGMTDVSARGNRGQGPPEALPGKTHILMSVIPATPSAVGQLEARPMDRPRNAAMTMSDIACMSIETGSGTATS